ncbi:unnamed protein product, partial [Phaeothamnion confervicola]
MLQIYNEQVFDMLQDPQRSRPLSVREDGGSGGGIYVQSLSEFAVHTAAECLQLLRRGEEHRAIRETHMNQLSSRSHSILQLVLEQRRTEPTGERVLRSKFNLVDLAGSEKWDTKRSGQMEDARISEMTSINVSLYTLGRVIASLSARATAFATGGGGQQHQHVPYRDSKLTRLLQDSLGGNTKTRLIVTLSPASDCVDETLSALRFADRAKQVMALVRLNEERPVDYATVQRLRREVRHLRAVVRELTGGDGSGYSGGSGGNGDGRSSGTGGGGDGEDGSRSNADGNIGGGRGADNTAKLMYARAALKRQMEETEA